MGIMCSYKLWILGEDTKYVIDQVVDDDWTLVWHSEMGAEFECEGKTLLRSAPTFSEYPRLVIVMSADHDANMGFHHLLSVEQCGHFVSRFWPYDEERDEELEAITNDGFEPDNLISESLFNDGIAETIRRFGVADKPFDTCGVDAAKELAFQFSELIVESFMSGDPSEDGIPLSEWLKAPSPAVDDKSIAEKLCEVFEWNAMNARHYLPDRPPGSVPLSTLREIEGRVLQEALSGEWDDGAAEDLQHIRTGGASDWSEGGTNGGEMT